MLHIYVAEHCPGSPTACRRAEWVREHAPEIPVELINISVPGTSVPTAVFGTPTYTWNDRIIFLGNPSEQELLERARNLYERTAS